MEISHVCKSSLTVSNVHTNNINTMNLFQGALNNKKNEMIKTTTLCIPKFKLAKYIYNYIYKSIIFIGRFYNLFVDSVYKGQGENGNFTGELQQIQFQH